MNEWDDDSSNASIMEYQSDSFIISYSSKLMIKTDLNDDGICFLARDILLHNITTVRKLIIWCWSNNSKVTIKGWEAIFLALQTTKSMETLKFDESNFNYKIAQLFATTVLNNTMNISTPICSSLTNLSIRYNDEIGINGVSIIVEALCANPNRCNTMRKLTLDGVIKVNEGTVQEKQQLATQFVTLLTQNGTALEKLNLANNYLGDDFVSIFVTGLKGNKTQLKKLNLSGNALTYVGCKAIANVLYYNRTLVSLDLSYNEKDDWIEDVTRALRYQPTLRFVRFSSVSNLFHIVNFLEYNESMVKVSLEDFKSIAEVKQIQSMIQYNDTIKEVHFLNMTNRFEERTAPNKGIRRRQHIFTWLNDDWLGPTDKTTEQVS